MISKLKVETIEFCEDFWYNDRQKAGVSAMAYKALYRTYRPNTFDEVVGQQHIVQTLRNAVEQKKIAHAYLFCGPRGTGKTSIAKVFAKAINCVDKKHPPCMECESCLAITQGTHPDIIEIDAASNNGVEEVRNLIEKVKYAPIEGIYKVYIIDEVHMMSAGAFNALLKTIEEPPAHVIFILATTEPQKVLPTIVSRCQRYDFHKIGVSEIEQRLRYGLAQENITCEDEVFRIVAQLSDGGMRDAWSIMDQCIAYAQNNIQVHHINEIYGILSTQEKLLLLDTVVAKDAVACMDFMQQHAAKNVDIKRLTMELIELVKESIVYEYTKEETLLHKLTSEECRHLVQSSSISHRYHMIDTLMETYDKYRYAADVSCYFEVCLLKMMESPQTMDAPKDSSIRSDQMDPIKPSTETRQAYEDKPAVAHLTSIDQKLPDQPNKASKNVSRETLIEQQSDVAYDHEEWIEESIPQEIEEKKDLLTEPNSDDLQTEPLTAQGIQPLGDEYVLRLLVGANKPEKQQDMQAFAQIQSYAMHLTWARTANLLKHGTIMASGTTYLLLMVNTQAEANEINEQDQKGEFRALTLELFHKEKKIFAITGEQSQRVTGLFRQRMSEGTLPDPLTFTVQTNKAESHEPTQEDIMFDLFGTDNLMITEE